VGGGCVLVGEWVVGSVSGWWAVVVGECGWWVMGGWLVSVGDVGIGGWWVL